MHYVFVTATWLLGTLGVAGAAAAIAGCIFLGPVAVQTIVAPIISKFISCTKCVAVAVLILSAVGSFWIGHHSAVVDCRDEKANSIIAAQRRDITIAQQAAADEANRAIAIETEAKDQHEKDVATIEGLKSRPNAACAFDDGDFGGVRPIVRSPQKKPAGRARQTVGESAGSASR